MEDNYVSETFSVAYKHQIVHSVACVEQSALLIVTD